MRSFVPVSPFAKELGIELVDLRLDHAELRLPWSPRLATMSDVAAAARATDLTARATVVRRGRSLCFCEVTVVDAADAVVAHGSMVHRYG
jgi:acyl-coenzyme A thioesterase PaaI-like protein